MSENFSEIKSKWMLYEFYAYIYLANEQKTPEHLLTHITTMI